MRETSFDVESALIHPSGAPLQFFGDRNVPIAYVLNAQTYLDLDFNNTFDSDEPGDATPATFSFTVIPGTTSQFIEPKDRPEDQPVKVYENK